MLYIQNPIAIDDNDKLRVTEATLMGFQAGMDHFYKGFVEDTHLFLSVKE